MQATSPINRYICACNNRRPDCIYTVLKEIENNYPKKRGHDIHRSRPSRMERQNFKPLAPANSMVLPLHIPFIRCFGGDTPVSPMIAIQSMDKLYFWVLFTIDICAVCINRKANRCISLSTSTHKYISRPIQELHNTDASPAVTKTL